MSYDDSIMDFNGDAANGIVMEGYLYKRASNAFKTWSRYNFAVCFCSHEPHCDKSDVHRAFACPAVNENS